MNAPLVFVRDGRTLPYVPVTQAALDAIAAHVPARRLAYGRSMYLALLEMANEARGASAAVSRKELGERAGCSRELVSDLTPLLVGAGVIEVHERSHGSQRLENEWVIVEPRTSDPCACQAGGSCLAGRGVVPARQGGRACEAQLPLEGEEVKEGSSSSSARASQELADRDDEDVLDVPPELMLTAQQLQASKRKVGSLVVRWPEMLLAAAVVAEWNRQSGQALTLGAWLDDVVRRAREQPQLTAAQHVELVRAAWRTKWWAKRGSSRRPDLAVIYGNARQFDRCIQDATQEAESGVQPWVRTKAVQEW